MRIPYTYVTVSKSDAANRSMDAHAEFEPVRVAERDAPVALRHKGFFGSYASLDDGLEARPERPVDLLTDVRRHGDGLYEAVVLNTGYRDDGLRRLATPDDVASVDDATYLLRDVKWIARRQQNPGAKYWNEVTRMVFSKSERETALEDVTMALDVIVVGNVLHRRTREPVLQLHEGVVRVVPGDGAQGKVYRLDEVDLLADRLRALGGRDAEAAVAAAREMTQLLDPGALRVDVRDDALLDAARSLRDAARWDLATRNLDTMMAFKDLDDALDHDRRGPADRLVGPMAAYCEHMDAERGKVGHRDHARDCAVARAELRAHATRSAAAGPRCVDEPDLDGVDLDGPRP